MKSDIVYVFDLEKIVLLTDKEQEVFICFDNGKIIALRGRAREEFFTAYFNFNKKNLDISSIWKEKVK